MFAFVFLVLAIQHHFYACSVTSVMSSSLRSLDYSPPSSSVHGILQARILECVSMPSFRGSSWLWDWTCVSYISCTGSSLPLASDMTERLHFHFSLSCIGEGNGNPLQCSCLENPRDGGARWAAVSGVTQSRARLKWLSSSSSSSSSITHFIFIKDLAKYML